MFARSHIISPHGAAAVQALPRTKIVLSKIERTKTLPNCGRRYGGSSRVKEEGIPLSRVCDKSLEIASVAATPSRIAPRSRSADITDENLFPAVTKNIVIIAIIVGNRPLQGTKLLVRIAISRSRGESIIRHPVTPQALQPNPIAIVIDCFPQALQQRKQRSRLNAILGRYPASSRIVKSGKNIAIAGFKINRNKYRSKQYNFIRILEVRYGK